jgi:hypothetical protein
LEGAGTNKIKLQWGNTSGVVSVKKVNECGTASSASLMNVLVQSCTTSIARGIPVASNVSVSIIPNPANSQFNVQLSGYTGKVNLQLKSVDGKMLMGKNIEATSARFAQQTFNVSSLAIGVYILLVTDEQGNVKTEKVLIMR